MTLEKYMYVPVFGKDRCTRYRKLNEKGCMELWWKVCMLLGAGVLGR